MQAVVVCAEELRPTENTENTENEAEGAFCEELQQSYGEEEDLFDDSVSSPAPYRRLLLPADIFIKDQMNGREKKEMRRQKEKSIRARKNHGLQLGGASAFVPTPNPSTAQPLETPLPHIPQAAFDLIEARKRLQLCENELFRVQSKWMSATRECSQAAHSERRNWEGLCTTTEYEQLRLPRFEAEQRQATALENLWMARRDVRLLEVDLYFADREELEILQEAVFRLVPEITDNNSWPPTSIASCKQVLDSVSINIFDYVSGIDRSQLSPDDSEKRENLDRSYNQRYPRARASNPGLVFLLQHSSEQAKSLTRAQVAEKEQQALEKIASFQARLQSREAAIEAAKCNTEKINSETGGRQAELLKSMIDQAVDAKLRLKRWRFKYQCVQADKYFVERTALDILQEAVTRLAPAALDKAGKPPGTVENCERALRSALAGKYLYVFDYIAGKSTAYTAEELLAREAEDGSYPCYRAINPALRFLVTQFGRARQGEARN